jgi:protein NrfD
MHEIVNSRHNELVDPFFQAWGWEIPIYLFLGGLVAGMMILSGYFILQNRQKENTCSCHVTPIISFIALSLGMLSLFLDLEHKLYVWRLYLTFKISSPMSWGSWILILVYPALIGSVMLNPPEKLKKKYNFISVISNKINSKSNFIKIIGILNVLLGVALGIYTGVLLSTLGARPLWNSSMLWILFLISGLSSAAALIHMISKNKHESELLAKYDSAFLFTELFIIILFIVGLLSSTQVHIDAAKLILNGNFASVFWVFVVGLGIIIPLIIQPLAAYHKIQHTPVAPLLVLLGGLILRFVIVYAGQYSHWR